MSAPREMIGTTFWRYDETKSRALGDGDADDGRLIRLVQRLAVLQSWRH